MLKKIEIDNKSLNNILLEAEELGLAIDYFEGTLIDNSIIYNDKVLKFKDMPDTDYIIMNAKYLNEWYSKTEMIFTNDFKLVDEYIDAWGGYEED